MLSLTTNVCILCWETPGPFENYARKIAEFLGVNATFAFAAGARDLDSIRKQVPEGAALISHADVLARVAEASGRDGTGFTALSRHLFVQGFSPSADHAALIRSLSSGAFLGVEAPSTDETDFHVADDQREWCGQFTGLSLSGVDHSKDCVFQPARPARGRAVLIEVGTRPFLVRIGRGGSQVFLAGSTELADLDRTVNSQAGLLPWFSRLVPLLMFLKKSLGNHAWHSDRSQACFIIDDPLLKPRYGFLQYTKLLEAIRGNKFSCSIAFIPWNYRRSSTQIADLFLTKPRALSLCVHGCDHTKAEFASAGPDLLGGKARLALDRMRAHKQRSGVPFDEVMVFPQGLFSVEAIKALAASDYVASVNTDLCPSNRPQVLPLRSLMDVAVAEFADVPLFGRHYPIDAVDFAFDLFLGKPALAVAHHGYFRMGYEPLVTFVKRLNELDELLEWNSLGTVCTTACLKKVTPEGDIQVRFYADRFRLTNDDTQVRRYILFQRRTGGSSVRSVTVNGRPCDQEDTGDRLRITLSLEPGQSADVRINAGGEAGTRSWKTTMAHSAGVMVRRLLCELRDNHLETNWFLSSLLTRLRPLRTKEKKSDRSLRVPELKTDTKSIEEMCR